MRKSSAILGALAVMAATINLAPLPASAALGDASISGTVTGEGLPTTPVNADKLSGIVVTAYSLNATTQEWTTQAAQATTSSTGSYSLAVPAGNYRVGFDSPSLQWIDEFFDDKQAVADATTVSPTLLSPAKANAALEQRYSVKGLVTSTRDVNLPGITVGAYEDSGDNWTKEAETTTGSDGTYTLWAPAGDYKIRFSSSSGRWQEELYDNKIDVPFESAATITVPGNKTGINAKLTEQVSISGTVLAGGNALPDAKVTALRSDPETGRWTAKKSSTTDDDGNYQFWVPEGAYRIQFMGDTCLWKSQYFNNKATVGEGIDISQDATGVDADLQARTSAPVNDKFTNATALTGDSATAMGTNCDATEQTGEPFHTGDPAPPHSVWWTWTPDHGGSTTIDLSDSDFDTDVAVYTGSSVSALTEVAADADSGALPGTSKVTFSSTTGTTYWIAVDGRAAARGSITLELTHAPATGISGTVTGAGLPADDKALSGIVVTAYAQNATTGEWTTEAATATTSASGTYSLPVEPGEYRIEFDSPTQQWVDEFFDDVATIATATTVPSAPESPATADAELAQRYTIKGLVTSTDDVSLSGITVRAYQGSGDNWTVQAQTTTGADGSYTLWAPTGSYKIRFSSDTGQWQEELYDNKVDAPFSEATSVTVPASKSGINAKLTKNMSLAGTVTDGSAPVPGARVTALRLDTGSGKWTAIKSTTTDDDGTYQFSVREGKYRIQFQADTCALTTEYFNNAATVGAGTDVTANATGVDASLAARTASPVNDKFSDATVLSGNTATANGTNCGATEQTGEPVHAGDANPLHSVWWNWTATTSGATTINLSDSDFDTSLGVYRGSSVTALTAVAADADGGALPGTSKVTFNAVAGTTYRIAVDGREGARGSIRLALSHTSTNAPPVAVDDTASAKSNRALPIAVTANDTDTQTPPASLVATAAKATSKGGTVSCSGGTCTYTSALNFTGPDAFVYKVTDGGGLTDTARVTVNVGCTITGTAGSDRIAPDAANPALKTTNGPEVICGGDGNDVIAGAGGHDRILGGNGDDVIAGGDGNDRVYGGSGADRLYGQGGSDVLFGGTGNDRIVGGDGADKGYGQTGNDALYGVAGSDGLSGGPGADIVNGGTGNDRLWGADGNDRLYGTGGDDALYGGNGTDTCTQGAGRGIRRACER